MRSDPSDDPKYEPRIYAVVGGFHAAGIGWAVFGRTESEALENFRQAQVRHIEIMTRFRRPASEASLPMADDTRRVE